LPGFGEDGGGGEAGDGVDFEEVSSDVVDDVVDSGDSSASEEMVDFFGIFFEVFLEIGLDVSEYFITPVRVVLLFVVEELP